MKNTYSILCRRYSVHSYHTLLGLDKLIPGVREHSRHAVSRANTRFQTGNDGGRSLSQVLSRRASRRLFELRGRSSPSFSCTLCLPSSHLVVVVVVVTVVTVVVVVVVP